MVSTTDGNIVCMPPFHTVVWEIKSLTHLRLPRGLAFVPSRKHSSLDSQQLPTEKQRHENLKTLMSDIRGQILRRSHLDKCLLYKSHQPVSHTCTSRSLYVSSLVFSYVFIFFHFERWILLVSVKKYTLCSQTCSSQHTLKHDKTI